MALKYNITPEQIYQQIGCVNLFNKYFGTFDYSTAYHSRLRQDNKKSTGFYVQEAKYNKQGKVISGGKVIYNDLTTGKKYNAISFVMALFKLDFYNALQRIAFDFKLTGDPNIKPVLQVVQPPPIKETKHFSITTKPFTKADLKFWQQFGITKQELINNNIYSVYSVKVKTFTIFTEPDELKFAYLFKNDKGVGYVKIYTPYSEQWKWAGNVPLNLPFGLHSLPVNSDSLIITKSVKDCLLLRKWFPDCIGLQNESPSSITKETIKALKRCYKHIYIWFDFDRPGLSAANYYYKKHGFIPIFTLPIKQNVWRQLTKAKQQGIKDPSDFVKQYGLPLFEQYLKHIKLLNDLS